MKNNNLIRCSQISVNCVTNDPVDVRCGGSQYFGFDFNVTEDKTEEMKKFIEVTLATFEVPLVSIYVKGTIELHEEKIWTKEKIVKEIQKDARYLQSQAQRNYRPYFRR